RPPRNEGLRAVDGIEDPDELGVAAVGAMLLADHAVVGIALADQRADGRLGRAVGQRDRALVRLRLDPDAAAEIAPGDRAAGIGEPAGEGDEIIGYGRHRAGPRRDDRRACFDRLSMRNFLRATKKRPHPELVEGRLVSLQPRYGSGFGESLSVRR